jgi:hypothetical protein
MDIDTQPPAMSPREIERRLEDEYQAGYVTGHHRALQIGDRPRRALWIAGVVGFSAGLMLGVLF